MDLSSWVAVSRSVGKKNPHAACWSPVITASKKVSPDGVMLSQTHLVAYSHNSSFISNMHAICSAYPILSFNCQDDSYHICCNVFKDGEVIYISYRCNVVAGIAQWFIATRQRLDGPGIESRWGSTFPLLFRPTHPASWNPPRGKVARAWFWPPTS
jgi:hypothetical protein